MSPSSSTVRVENEGEEARFLREFEALGCDPYLYKEELLINKRAEIFCKLNAKKFKYVKELGNQFINAVDLSGGVKHYSYSELEEFTESFSSKNLIFETYHGRFFQGKIKNQEVLVKIWDFSFNKKYDCHYHTHRILDELTFLRVPEIKSHPSVVKLIGYHCDQSLAVVYDGKKPECCLNEVIPSDDFGWKDRMKVAVDMGNMLKTFHDNNHVHGGVVADIIMLDKEFNSKSYDFRIYSYNEIFEKLYLPYTFMPDSADLIRKCEEGRGDKWSTSDDVFMYGVLLLELITKEKPTYSVMRTWSQDWVVDGRAPKSAVHKSLDNEVDEENASKITKLALSCLEGKKMKKKVDVGKVVKDLKNIIESINNTRAAKRQKVV